MLTGYLAAGLIVVDPNGGGLPIVETEPPEAPEGFEARPHWSESNGSIVQVWEMAPVEGTPQEAALALSRAQFMSLPDGAAYALRALAPLWTAGESYTGPGDPSGAVQSRVLFNGRLFKCLQSHVAQLSWTPPEAPSLWAEILPGQEGSGEEVGEWVQPGSTNGYQKGDRVTHAGHLWESTHDGDNVWEPGAVGAPWKDLGEYPPAEGEE